MGKRVLGEVEEMSLEEVSLILVSRSFTMASGKRMSVFESPTSPVTSICTTTWNTILSDNTCVLSHKSKLGLCIFETYTQGIPVICTESSLRTAKKQALQ